ncbi:MAG TPA: hypothetical protein VF245_10875 [Solirubrobacterales bacterium]
MAEAGSAAALSAGAVGRWTGYGVDDIDGSAVGQVHGLFVDADSGEPSWLIVRQGRLRGTLVAVPLRDCAAAVDRVWVAQGRETIRTAPVVDPLRPLLREHELTICNHFRIGERVGRAAEVAGRAEGTVTSKPT